MKNLDLKSDCKQVQKWQTTPRLENGCGNYLSDELTRNTYVQWCVKMCLVISVYTIEPRKGRRMKLVKERKIVLSNFNISGWRTKTYIVQILTLMEFNFYEHFSYFIDWIWVANDELFWTPYIAQDKTQAGHKTNEAVAHRAWYQVAVDGPILVRNLHQERCNC